MNMRFSGISILSVALIIFVAVISSCSKADDWANYTAEGYSVKFFAGDTELSFVKGQPLCIDIAQPVRIVTYENGVEVPLSYASSSYSDEKIVLETDIEYSGESGTIKYFAIAPKTIGKTKVQVRFFKEGMPGTVLLRRTFQVAVQPESVDLGLSVRWCVSNLGAKSASESGKYYYWGDTIGQTQNSRGWSGGGFRSLTLYTKINNGIVLYPSYDAAVAASNGCGMRMPTAGELSELIQNSTVSVCDFGYRFTSKIPGYTDKFIEIGTFGYGYGEELVTDGYGYYWTTNIDTKNKEQAACLKMGPAGNIQTSDNVFYGFNIRPVLEKL